MIRNRVLMVVDQMNSEFLAPMQAFAKLFHCIRTVRAGKHTANVKASWLTIGLMKDEIAKIRAEPDTVLTETTYFVLMLWRIRWCLISHVTCHY